MNVERLKAVRDAILADPEHYNQEYLFGQINRTLGTNEPTTVCDTACCIAGRAALMFHPEGKRMELDAINNKARVMRNSNDYYESWVAAEEVLELTREEGDRLFSSVDLDEDTDEEEYNDNRSGNSGWPYEYAKRYIEAKNGEEMAQVAADRIDHFIATNGIE